eukprot:COSAG02_NODE_2256_length_9341_cov_36.469271_4_plen_46_part_00
MAVTTGSAMATAVYLSALLSIILLTAAPAPLLASTQPQVHAVVLD